MRRLPLAALAAVGLVLGACGSPTAPAPPPPLPPPSITCDPGVLVEDLVTPSAPISYTTPPASAGSPPVSVTCTPPSGSEFPLGETVVTCVAVDALSRQASCSFTVTLRHRVLALTTYLAFGDSLTEGENGRPLGLIPVVDIAHSYPTLLQAIFSQRIPSLQVTVVNAGFGGEKAVGNGNRLIDRIQAVRPDVLLLLEGINDLLAGANRQDVVNALRDDIRIALQRNVKYVFVSTLLPVAPENCGPAPPACRGSLTTNNIINMTNQGIRAMVPANGANLVDPYDLFLANRTTFVDIDGLHLRPDGNQALAEAFWSRIVQVIPAKQLFGF